MLNTSLTGLKSRCCLLPSGCSRENLLLYLFQLLEAACISWLWPLLQQCAAESSSHCHLSVPLLTLKAYCDGPTQIIQHNLPNLSAQLISNLDSLCNLSPSLTCSLIYSQEPGIRLWTSLGVHYPAYHIILPIKGFIIIHNKKSRSEGLQEGSGCATPSYTRSYVSLLNRLHRASLSLGAGCGNGCLLRHCRNNHLQLKQPRLWRGCFFSCISLPGMKTFSKVSREGCVSLAGMVTHHVSPSEARAWGRLEARVTGFLKGRTKGEWLLDRSPAASEASSERLGAGLMINQWAAAGRTWNFEGAVPQGTLLKAPIHDILWDYKMDYNFIKKS